MVYRLPLLLQFTRRAHIFIEKLGGTLHESPPFGGKQGMFLTLMAENSRVFFRIDERVIHFLRPLWRRACQGGPVVTAIRDLHGSGYQIKMIERRHCLEHGWVDHGVKV